MEEQIAKGGLHTMLMVAGLDCSHQCAAIWGFSGKIPILYGLKNKQNPRNRSACPHQATSGHTPTAQPCSQCGVPWEGYSLFLGTGLYGEPFLPWCTRQTRCPLPNTRWLKPAGDPIHLSLNSLPHKDIPSWSMGAFVTYWTPHLLNNPFLNCPIGRASQRQVCFSELQVRPCQVPWLSVVHPLLWG